MKKKQNYTKRQYVGIDFFTARDKIKIKLIIIIIGYRPRLFLYNKYDIRKFGDTHAST